MIGSYRRKGENALLIVVLIMPMAGCIPAHKAAQRAPPSEWPTQAWPTSAPEEQGVDATLLAAGLQAIRQQGLKLHSLLLVRNGKLLLDAYFYPYDGKTVHDIRILVPSQLSPMFTAQPM